MVRLFGREDRRRHELLSAYVDGEVTAEEAREVEEFLASSEDARRELAELQATVDLVRGLPELEPPRSFALDAAPERRWTLWWPSVRATGLATSVAAMLLVALVAGDMLNVLAQASFGADESEAMYDSALDDAAFAAAASEPAPEVMAGAAMDVPATPEPEAALMKSAASEDESAQVAAAPAAAALRMAKVESSEEQAVAMQQASTEEAPQADQAESDEEPQLGMRSVMSADEQQAEEAPQADQAESDEEPQLGMRSVMSADEPQADETESSEEPLAAMQQASTDDGEIIEGDAVVDYYEIDGRDPERITLPLAEFQVVTAIVVVVLAGVTLVAIRRRRRSIL